ncbi:PLP-dependent aminotransferase family protein [Paenibacillus filicis]|uniref:PLP-dependent aminotransferase family protein n=1 Tax=Paenibacillus filicis TaxID=669464 RepID=A0ABU9DMZ4_9BACL
MLKYMLLLNELEGLLDSGAIREGGKLPSVRQLAESHNVNKATVIRALQELEKRHLIYAVPQSGYYAVGKERQAEESSTRNLDFATSAPDPDVFPYLDFKHCINQAIDIYKNELFVYGTPKGLPTLIPVIQKQLANHQVFTDPDRIVITAGVQQALSLLVAMPFPNGKSNILIEQPGYHLLIAHLKTHGIRALGIARDERGLDWTELERMFREEDIKFFYTMPRFQNPLGVSYNKQEKLRMLELAARYDVYLVEDDYMADFETDTKADPLYAYDTGSPSRVIYLKSYSKIIFPGLRVGVAVLPEELVGMFRSYKHVLDIDSSMLSQAALEIYIKSGMFERHRQKISGSYLQRSRVLQGSLERAKERLPAKLQAGFPSKSPFMHTHLVLDRSVNVGALISRMRKQGVLLDSIDKHMLSTFPLPNLLKLTVSNVKEKDIEQGIQRITNGLLALYRG